MSQITPNSNEPSAIAGETETRSAPASSPSQTSAMRSALWQTKPQDPTLTALAEFTTRDLARALLERLSLDESDWHRLKGDRRRRAQEQVAAALVFMVAEGQNNPTNDQEAHQRLEQALGWLDRRITAPPCPDHATRSSKRNRDRSET